MKFRSLGHSPSDKRFFHRKWYPCFIYISMLNYCNLAFIDPLGFQEHRFCFLLSILQKMLNFLSHWLFTNCNQSGNRTLLWIFSSQPLSHHLKFTQKVDKDGSLYRKNGMPTYMCLWTVIIIWNLNIRIFSLIWSFSWRCNCHFILIFHFKYENNQGHLVMKVMKRMNKCIMGWVWAGTQIFLLEVHIFMRKEG